MSIKISIHSLVLILLLIMFNTACAQPNTDALIAAKRQATETFLDSTQPKKARLEAVKNLGYPEEKTFAELLRIGTDPNDDDEIRLIALQLYHYDDKYFDAVLSIISTPTESEKLATGLIEDISRRTTFRLPAEYRQRLQAALRERLDDSRPTVRLAAYRTLVASHDAVAIDKLVESLRSGNNIPIPVAEAIELLDVDGSNKHIGTLRPYLNSADTAVKAQAARALAVDPESQSDIVEMATNTQASREVRIKALRALSREDEQFMEYALKLIGNPDEHPDIRYEAMKGAMRRLNYQEESAANQISFARAVERLMGETGVITTDGKDLGVEAKKLLPHLRENFPAVGKYYRGRTN